MFFIRGWWTFNLCDISNISVRTECLYFQFFWSIFYPIRAEYRDLPNTDTFYRLFSELQNYKMFPASIWLFKVYNGNLRMWETCSKLTIKTPEHQNNVIDIVLISLVLTLNRFHTIAWCFSFQLWASQGQQVYL